MMRWWPRHRHHHHHLLLLRCGSGEQRRTLVNVRIRWVKDRPLDAVVARERHLRPVLDLVHALASSSSPAHHLSRRRLGLPDSAAAFMRRHPALFHESRRRPPPSSSSCSTICGRLRRPFRWFGLTPEALQLHREEAEIRRETEPELVDRLRKLLMLTAGRALPLPTVDQLRWDLGLPHDYAETLLPRYPAFFRLDTAADDERVWLRLVSWDDRLAVSRLQMDAASRDGERQQQPCLAFPLRFTRGFGLKKKCVRWLEEWQRLPYASPYDAAAAGRLDPRTDVAEKRVVGVFHELLHLTLGKKTERRNLSNLRGPLGLPYKFTKVFGRHPGIFYLSEKLATQTVVLREAYGGGRELLLEKHPLMGIRERFTALMRVSSGTEEEEEENNGRRRSRGQERNVCDDNHTNDSDDADADPLRPDNVSEEWDDSEECNLFLESSSDEAVDAPCC